MVYYLDEIKDIKPFTQDPKISLKYVSETYILFIFNKICF